MSRLGILAVAWVTLLLSAQSIHAKSFLYGEVGWGVKFDKRSTISPLFTLGKYRAYGDKYLVGVIANGAIDRYRSRDFPEWVLPFVAGVGVMRFASGQPGKGFFVKSDLGLFHAIIRERKDWKMHPEGMGWGIVAGVGRGWAMEGESRLMFQAGVSIRDFFKPGDVYNSYNAAMGVLF